MKSVTLFVSGSLALSMMVLAGAAIAADTGVGVCVVGIGASMNDELGPGPYVGVNAGQNSTTGAYDNNEDFEEQCCAETGSPPDCFAPVE